MSPPATREELLEVIRHAMREYGLIASDCLAATPQALKNASVFVLTAPEAAGCRIVPVEATEETLDAPDDAFHAEIARQTAFARKHNKPLGYASGPFSRLVYASILDASPYKPQRNR